MPFRVLSGVMALFFAWAAAMQLNDPDPERWFAMYASAALFAALAAFGRVLPLLGAAVVVIALVWAASIVPELLGRWTPSDLGATMSQARPEVEFGRELGGLLIMVAYGIVALLLHRRVQRARSAGGQAIANA